MWSFYPEAAGHWFGTGQYPTTQNLTTQSCQHTITPESDQFAVSEINILNIATQITAIKWTGGALWGESGKICKDKTRLGYNVLGMYLRTIGIFFSIKKICEK